MSAAWTLWDGRRLAWDGVHGATELRLDGVRFTPADERGEYTFPFCPNGDVRLEFALHAADGAACVSPWRVRYGVAASAGIDAWHGDAAPLATLPAPNTPLPPRARVSIAIPIHNSTDCVQRCVESVLRWTAAPARLILIDDASTDPGIGVLLARYAGVDGIVIERNAENLGYTRSTNRGIALAQDDDVVLLNSDTEVGPRWLEALRTAAYADAQRGTVTAVSDNAGAFSVPELEHYCPIPASWSLPQTQRALLRQAGGVLPELPTGNGFCMYVKRALFDAVGVLDADAFPFGYGEENDLCQRAERAGWQHAIAGDVLVRHARSASFGHERRAALGQQGMAVLRARYPDYEAKVGATLFSFERRVLDWRVRRIYAMAATQTPRPRVLLDGAAVALAAALRERYECFALDTDCATLRALDGVGDTRRGIDLAATLAANAIEIVHGHGLDAGLSAAAALAGAACVDSRDDASLTASAAGSDNAWLAARCTRRYAEAWRDRAAWPALEPAEESA
jgi:GT2 family glycosyltransferase